MESIRTSGAFDEIRMDLLDHAYSTEEFRYLTDKFEEDCRKFCREVNLEEEKKVLRRQLEKKFGTQNYSPTGCKITHYVRRLLEDRDNDLHRKYYSLAEKFLEKFLPQPSPTPSIPLPTTSPQLEDLHDQKRIANPDDETAVDMETSPLSDDDLDHLRPTYSPVGNGEVVNTPLEQITPEERRSPEEKNCMNNDIPLDQVIMPEGLPPKEDSSAEIPMDEDLPTMDVSAEDIPKREVKIEDTIQSQPDEDSESLLTFSSVSSIHTADLTDYDNSIKLSDDEADIVGKPKNSKVPVEVIQDQIYDLQTTNVDVKQEQKESTLDINNLARTEPIASNVTAATTTTTTTMITTTTTELHEASESDGGCSESANSVKRATRTRKSNTRFSGFLTSFK